LSNYLSIAAVTATIGRRVSQALEDVPNPSAIPKVRFGPPQSDPQYIGCTIFMFRVTPNASLRNDDLPTRDEQGRYLRKPTLSLDADYLLTFAGDEPTLEAQRFLGAVAVAFHVEPFLNPEDIQRTIAAASYLRGSDLGARPGSVRILPSALDAHLMSQLWSTFPQVQYNVSMLYTASAIPVEADVATYLPTLVRDVDTQVKLP